MSPHPGLTRARELYSKLERDASALRTLVSPDSFFNFVVTAWSLCDWAEKDPILSPTAHKDAAGVRATRWLQICRDLANGSKHFRVTTYTPSVSTTAASRGYGVGRSGVGAFGA